MYSEVNSYKRLYDKVEAAAQQRLTAILNEGMGTMVCFAVFLFLTQFGKWLQVQANALSMLTRLRQIALHPGLIPRSYVEELQSQGTQKSLAPRTPLEISRLRQVLAQAIEDCEECPICLSLFNEPRITSCSHMYCLSWYACIKLLAPY